MYVCMCIFIPTNMQRCFGLVSLFNSISTFFDRSIVRGIELNRVREIERWIESKFFIFGKICTN